MSKDTVNQKIRRNIKELFKKSEILAKAYPDDMVFNYIELWCHRIVLHYDPIYTINFDDEIDMLKEADELDYSGLCKNCGGEI